MTSDFTEPIRLSSWSENAGIKYFSLYSTLVGKIESRLH